MGTSLGESGLAKFARPTSVKLPDKSAKTKLDREENGQIALFFGVNPDWTAKAFRCIAPGSAALSRASRQPAVRQL
jgi:hypothetical protein